MKSDQWPIEIEDVVYHIDASYSQESCVYKYIGNDEWLHVASGCTLSTSVVAAGILNAKEGQCVIFAHSDGQLVLPVKIDTEVEGGDDSEFKQKNTA